jgi:hypothetical protein
MLAEKFQKNTPSGGCPRPSGAVCCIRYVTQGRGVSALRSAPPKESKRAGREGEHGRRRERADLGWNGPTAGGAPARECSEAGNAGARERADAHSTGMWGSTFRPGYSGVYGQHTGTSGYGLAGDGKGAGSAGVLGRNPSGYGGRFEGGKAQFLLIPGASPGPPTGAHTKGEIYLDSAAALWVCVKGGPDSEWRKVATTIASP